MLRPERPPRHAGFLHPVTWLILATCAGCWPFCTTPAGNSDAGPDQHICGSGGQPCCDGTACNAGFVCAESLCTALCGAEGQACCEGTACNTGLVCAAGSCGVSTPLDGGNAGVDAGLSPGSDAGSPDAGVSVDAGTVAGGADAGSSGTAQDAGVSLDAGTDAGSSGTAQDAGVSVDAGAPVDAGTLTAGSWSNVPVSYSGSYAALYGVWGSASHDVWAVGPDGFVRWNGISWQSQTSSTPALHGWSVWGSSTSDVWVAGGGPLLHWDGMGWSSTLEPAQNADLMGVVWGTSATDVWASGNDGDTGLFAHWNGTAWSNVNNPITGGPNLLGGGTYALWGSGTAAVWSVGGEYVGAAWWVQGWNGTSWSLSYAGQSTAGESTILRGVWGSDANNVWAVGGVDGDGGSSGIILKWDGQSWSVVENGPAGVVLTAVWGSSSTDVWAVGVVTAPAVSESPILHWNGSTWSTIAGAAGDSLYGIWGSSSTDVWAVGANGDPNTDMTSGVTLHWSGAPPP